MFCHRNSYAYISSNSFFSQKYCIGINYSTLVYGFLINEYVNETIAAKSTEEFICVIAIQSNLCRF